MLLTSFNVFIGEMPIFSFILFIYILFYFIYFFFFQESLTKMLSEYGKVLNTYIGKPSKEYLSSRTTWGIVKVESMK